MEKLAVIIPVLTEEDKNLLSLTVESISSTLSKEIGISVYIYSKRQISPYPGSITIVDKNLSILNVIKSASKFSEIVLCKPGVVFLSNDWAKTFRDLVIRNKKSFVGAVCQSGGSRIRGYAFNKKLLTLSPVPIGGEINIRGGEVGLVRYVLATTGDNLKEVVDKFTDKGYDWDIQVVEISRCVVSPVVVDVSKANKKFNLHKI